MSRKKAAKAKASLSLKPKPNIKACSGGVKKQQRKKFGRAAALLNEIQQCKRHRSPSDVAKITRLAGRSLVVLDSNMWLGHTPLCRHVVQRIKAQPLGSNCRVQLYMPRTVLQELGRPPPGALTTSLLCPWYREQLPGDAPAGGAGSSSSGAGGDAAILAACLGALASGAEAVLLVTADTAFRRRAAQHGINCCRPDEMVTRLAGLLAQAAAAPAVPTPSPRTSPQAAAGRRPASGPAIIAAAAAVSPQQLRPVHTRFASPLPASPLLLRAAAARQQKQQQQQPAGSPAAEATPQPAASPAAAAAARQPSGDMWSAEEERELLQLMVSSAYQQRRLGRGYKLHSRRAYTAFARHLRKPVEVVLLRAVQLLAGQ